MLSEFKWNYDLGIDALLTVCSRNTNGNMIWAWMLWSSYILPIRMEIWFGYRCSGRRRLFQDKRKYYLDMDALIAVGSSNINGSMVWAWMLWSPYVLPIRTEVWFGHRYSGRRRLFQYKRKYCLGMDNLVAVGSSNTNGNMVWAWMLWSPYVLPIRMEVWFGHRCSGHRMLF